MIAKKSGEECFLKKYWYVIILYIQPNFINLRKITTEYYPMKHASNFVVLRFVIDQVCGGPILIKLLHWHWGNHKT